MFSNVLITIFSPDGQTLASIGRVIGAITWWDIEARNKLTINSALDFDSDVSCIVFSPDSMTLALATTNGVRLWDKDRTVTPSQTFSDLSQFLTGWKDAGIGVQRRFSVLMGYENRQCRQRSL